MIYIIHNILALLKNHLNYLIMIENPKPENKKIIKDIRNLFRLKQD